ncbi:hypothetical protein JAAARDRAFT_35076 [Jaapia argillacea MUCL 33604]|uniref:Meiotically up-regulated protein Msb1/Mug8 domain-containing protein n=1 Tax=Jaapia argillacea MUCL 33604 TaxID=933084 RepID=A0A067PU48_9AGAM|nr:hypothetical protein JAAARDRAFT_35076 [Jaapia argillacea MUCL 33604]
MDLCGTRRRTKVQQRRNCDRSLRTVFFDDALSRSPSFLSMPSLFSRSRTTSTPAKKSSATSDSIVGNYDEFGRVSSRDSAHAGPGAVANTFGGRSNKEKREGGKGAKDRAHRLRTISSANRDRAAGPGGRAEPDAADWLAEVPDGSFLAMNLDPPHPHHQDSPEGRPRDHPTTDYGYLSYQRHVVLGLEQVARLADVISEELGTRGLTTPFIFSTLALDVSANAVKTLIKAFLRTCGNAERDRDAERLWRDEVRFANPNELGMCLRWGLARLVRIHGGQEVRGLIAFDYYHEWREAEVALNYPPTHFAALLKPLMPLVQTLISTVLTLLTRLTAQSSSSGHTPPTLSPLFGPLFFGLGSPALAFHHTYVQYLKAVNAMEHLMLSFIRWQDAHAAGAGSGSSAASFGVPARLKDWIRGYPTMLPAIERNPKEKPQARRGVRTMRVVSVRRNVRMYSPDLVRTGASWATRPRGVLSPPTSPGVAENGLANSKEWARIAPQTLKLAPRYSDGYKKRMDMATNFNPETGPGATPSISSSPSTSSTISSSSSMTTTTWLDDDFGLGGKKGEVRSLTDLKWGEFESMGFGGLGDEKKLQFDLTEGARAARSAKRATLTWQDFSSAGFSRNEAPLSATLQFSTPVAHTISSWPTHSAELHKKLKKTQKSLPSFGWDTEPVMGSEEVVEEAFLDVFCDLVYGGGWMDLERLEEVDRDCNWALVEFKSLPVSKSNTTSGTADPRTSTTLILFEEFVPFEYRQQLLESGRRRRLPSLFSLSPSSKSKQWKPAPTLNGRPYVIGHVPRSPSYQEVEFEGMLRGNNTSLTKLMTLEPGGGVVKTAAVPGGGVSRPTSSSGTVTARPVERVETPVGRYLVTPTSPMPRPASSVNKALPTLVTMNRSGSSTPPPPTPEKKKSSRFRLPGGLPVGGPGSTRKSGLTPAESNPVDFETRLASYSDDELNVTRTKAERRQSRDDAWVDILVASSSRRLGGQDADLRPMGTVRGLKGGRSDPELASQEVAQALAAVRGQVFSDDEDEDDEGMEPVRITPEDEVDGEHFGGMDSEVEDRFTQEVVDEDEEFTTSYTPQKRLGYFDLHPERRPTHLRDGEEDPRELLSRASEDESYEGDSDIYGGDPYGGSTQSHSQYGESSQTHNMLSAESAGEYDIEADSIHVSDIVSPPIETMTIPPVAAEEKNGILAPVARASPSKTAALIEMYRERERSTTLSPVPAPTPPRPSRSPVRPIVPPREESPLPVLPVIPEPIISPPTPPLDPALAVLDVPLPEPPRVVGDESGRATPPRYIHGAPLHNVLEEEEEE